MLRFQFVIGPWAGVLLLFVSTAVADTAEPTRRPNIVLLVADDLGYGELGCQGNPQIPTPHIDSIAAGGVRFTSGYVTAPYCSASRAGFISGRYQARFGYDDNPTGYRNEDPRAGLPPTETTLARQLHDAGYSTALIGKWHLGATPRYQPLRRGFDEFFGFLHEGHFYVPPPYRDVTTMLRRRALPNGEDGRWTSRDGRLILSTHMRHDEPPYDADNPILRGGQPVEEHEYLTDALTREAIDFIDRSKERPFFLYVAYNAVHSPLQGADAYLQRFKNIDDVHRRIFAAMLANLDDSVGAVLKKLQQERLDRDTLIFFLSDNGGPTRELTSSNRPLRGEKGQLFEGGIRVPFLMQWKGRVPEGRVYHHPVISLDLFPTIIAAAGSRPAERLDGVDLMPLVTTDQPSPRDALYWRIRDRAAIRAGSWKLIRDRRQFGDTRWHLFDLQNDLAESTDRAQRHPDRVAALRKRWEKWNQANQPPRDRLP